MKHGIAVLTAMLSLALGSTQSKADDPLELRFRMQAGKSYVYADQIRADVTQEMGGQEMKISTNSTIVSRFSVDGVREDGSISLTTVLDTLLSSVKSPGRDTTRLVTELMGKRSHVVISSLGKILERSIIDSLKSVGPMTRGSAVRELMRFHTLPEQKVLTGGQWTGATVDSNDAMGGKMTTVTNIAYTLAGNEKKGGRECLKITYTGTVAIEGRGTMMGADVFSEGKGTLSGTWYFDPEAGITVAEDGILDTDVTLAMTGQQNMTIPVTSSTKITRTLRAIEEIAK